MKLTEDNVLNALKTCYDPELPVNIVDLGLIYNVRLSDAPQSQQDVEVDLTLTTPGCPSHTTITEDIIRTLEAIPEVNMAKVNIVWSPPWGPERISPEGKQKLGIG